jgi:hypothetical protein
MMRAYLGIVSSRGLEWLLPENESVLRFLTGRTYANCPLQAVCCWAAMHAPAAAEIQYELEDGNSCTALRLLQASALFVGPILPSDARKSGWDDKPV